MVALRLRAPRRLRASLLRRPAPGISAGAGVPDVEGPTLAVVTALDQIADGLTVLRPFGPRRERRDVREHLRARERLDEAVAALIVPAGQRSPAALRPSSHPSIVMVAIQRAAPQHPSVFGLLGRATTVEEARERTSTMSEIAGELARVREAFDKPTLRLLDRKWAPFVLAVFKSSFSRDRRSVQADLLHTQVDAYLADLRTVGSEVPPGKNGRALCVQWMNDQWLYRETGEGEGGGGPRGALFAHLARARSAAPRRQPVP